MNSKEVAEKVVDRIIELIEQGEPLPWVKPWKRELDAVRIVDGYKVIKVAPRAWNRQGKLYNGANTYLPTGEYITFNQCKAEGGKIRKGAHGWPVVYWKRWEVKETDPDTGEEVKKTIPLLKYYMVFRIEDCEGLEQKHNPQSFEIKVPIVHYEPKEGEHDLNDAAEVIIADYVARSNGLELYRNEVTDRAFYRPSTDCTCLDRRWYK